MKTISTLAILAMLLVAAGCTDPGHYPISGKECSPDDPVQDMNAGGCLLSR